MTGEEFISLSVHPTLGDIETPAKLRRNKTEGKYRDANDYLGVQFRLYREDLVAKLRQGVKSTRAKPELTRKGLHGDFRVYKNFQLVNTVLSDGIKYILQVDMSDNLFRTGRWLTRTTCLSYGSLLCLSSDCFRSQIHFATVVKRPDQAKSQDDHTAVQISVFTPDLAIIDEMISSRKLLMVIESSVFYEAYQHVLESLKSLGRDVMSECYPFPFEKYLVRCETNIQLPAYMREPMQHLRLTCLAKTSPHEGMDVTTDTDSDYHSGRMKEPDDPEYTDLMPVSDTSSWPPAEEMGFNESQYKAYKAALTQEFCLIQGPPGTGKTHVGLKIVKTLLRNLYDDDVSHKSGFRNSMRRRGFFQTESRNDGKALHMNPPILLVCYTNHALDQFLEGILEFCPTKDVVRVGSQSKSEKVRNLNLNDRRRRNYPSYKYLGPQSKNMEEEHQTLLKTLCSITSSNVVISLKTLMDKGIIAYHFKRQLEHIATHQWLRQDSGHDSRLSAKFCESEMMSKGNVESLLARCVNDEENITDSSFRLWRRKQLYKRWIKDYQDELLSQIKRCKESYLSVLSRQRNIKKTQEVAALKDAKVIGMTTTGAARMQDVLQRVGPKIVIVEEAAEVLEAHIIAALGKSSEHLILIGDHRQLKPSNEVYELAARYNLDLSLFERMVNNKLPLQTLNIQHRMRPEVSKYLLHIYDTLDDHRSVWNCPPIDGISKPVFFLDHKEPETVAEGSMSKSNKHEAEMIVELARYLLKRKYKSKQITIICMYKGQELLIKQMVKSEGGFQGIGISSVDSFQGEENDIIIVSIVRSNKEDKLGFVKIENRICVTLSRAKLGMYVLGNFDFLRKGSDMWRKMIETAEHADELGDGLKLGCEKHHITASVRYPADFREHVPLGGCTKDCREVMECGHICKMKCHYDGHYEVRCQELCLRECVRGHSWQGKCFESTDCLVTVTEKLSCGHELTQRCFQWSTHINPVCREKCERKHPICGHKCELMCRDQCQEDCISPVDRVCSVSTCGEIKTQPCYLPFQCSAPCGEILKDCGHLCKGTCYSCGHNNRHLMVCKEPCGKTITSCGRHKCKVICSECRDYCMQEEDGENSHYICKELCDEVLPCGHKCHGSCIDCSNSCTHCPCGVQCQKKLECGHNCSSNCSKCSATGKCSQEQCVHQCHRIMSCGHECSSKQGCGECFKNGGCKEESCMQPCKMRCTHGNKCVKKCSEECDFMHKGKFRATSCYIGCKTHQGGCKQDCDEPCSTMPCDKPCPVKTKLCTRTSCRKQAQCIGLCGDPCPPFCRTCVPREETQGLDEKSINANTLWVELVDCGHVIPVDIMDQRVKSRKELNQVLRCPRKACKELVLNTPRYMSVVRQARFERSKTLRRDRKQREKEKEKTNTAKHSRKRPSTSDLYRPPKTPRLPSCTGSARNNSSSRFDGIKHVSARGLTSNSLGSTASVHNSRNSSLFSPPVRHSVPEQDQDDHIEFHRFRQSLRDSSDTHGINHRPVRSQVGGRKRASELRSTRKQALLSSVVTQHLSKSRSYRQ